MKLLTAVLAAALLAVSTYCFFLVVDTSLEIDDLKSQTRLQKDAIAFMQSVSNRMLETCTLNTSDLEAIAVSNHYHAAVWNNNQSLIGPFLVAKNGDCINQIRLVGLP